MLITRTGDFVTEVLSIGDFGLGGVRAAGPHFNSQETMGYPEGCGRRSQGPKSGFPKGLTLELRAQRETAKSSRLTL